jgi:2-polyprenyl-6-methoxyphenol hydroxylase-like FAD-dependent oxidoreductase
VARIVVLGAGLTGLAAALLLARDGHEVTVLERNSAGPVGDAEALWVDWQRPGASQFRLGHLMLGRWRSLMEQEFPDVLAEVERLGGQVLGPLDVLPASFTGGPRAGDEDLRFVQARRPVVEGAMAAVASRSRDLVVRRGVRAESLLQGAEVVEGVPHAAGVLTGSGKVIRAELVVDAMGRRSPLADMLGAIGARRPIEEREQLGFVYYGRHFRIVSDDVAPVATALIHFEGMSLLVIPADGRTFSVIFICAANDRELRALREERAWERVLALFPDLAQARAGSEPITSVQVMPGAEDRHLRFVHDGMPVATGVVVVGDAAIRTNPSLGRGSSIGLTQACVLRDVLREVGAERPERLVMRFAEACDVEVVPLYRRTLAYDRSRMAEIQADIAGVPHPPAGPDWSVTRALAALSVKDAGIMRAYMRAMSHVLEPASALDEPGVRARFDELAPMLPRYPEAPTRAQVLAAIHAVQRPVATSLARDLGATVIGPDEARC